jgi:hypothetical protein
MNPCRRIKYSEQRTVGPFEVTMNCIEDLSYDGKWESAGYDILFFGKNIGWFWGWPVNDDIKPLLDKETKH